MKIKCVQNTVPGLLVDMRGVCHVVQNYQNLIKFLHSQLLGLLGDLLLLGQDVAQCTFVPLIPPTLLAVRVHPQVLSDVLLDRFPLGVHVNARTLDVHALEAAPVLLQDHADQENGLPGSRRSAEDAVGGRPADHLVSRLLDVVGLAGEELHLSHLQSTVLCSIRSTFTMCCLPATGPAAASGAAGLRDWT